MDRMQPEGTLTPAIPKRPSSTTLEVDDRAPDRADSKDEECGRTTVESMPKEDNFDWEESTENPRNWSWGKKWTATAIVSPIPPPKGGGLTFHQIAYYTFVSPLASSMMAPGLIQVAEVYHIHNETVAALSLSIFLLAFAIAPLVIAPISVSRSSHHLTPLTL